MTDFAVTGGGWIDVDLDGLGIGADALGRCAAELRAIAGETAKIMADGDLIAAHVFSPVAAVRAEAALAGAELALGRRAVGVGLEGAALAAVRYLYERSEDAVRVVTDVAALPGDLENLLVSVSWALSNGDLDAAQRAAEYFLAERADVTEPLVGWLPRGISLVSLGAIALGGPPGWAAVLGASGAGFDPFPESMADVLRGPALYLPDGTGHALPVTADAPDPELDWAHRPPAGFGDLLQRVDDLYDYPYRPKRLPGEIAVQTVVGEDDVTRYIVEIPGTREWLPGSTNPQDLTSDVRVAAGLQNAYTEAIAEALRLVGAPAGSEILLAGHSLGGMAAMELAGDSAFNGGRYKVTHVVTAQAPIGGMEPAEGSGTKVLSLENTVDPVVGLDGEPNSGGPDHVTVSYAANRSSLWDNHTIFAPAGYELDTLDEPRVRAMRDDLARYFSGTAYTTVFQTYRTPD